MGKQFEQLKQQIIDGQPSLTVDILKDAYIEIRTEYLEQDIAKSKEYALQLFLSQIWKTIAESPEAKATFSTTLIEFIVRLDDLGLIVSLCPNMNMLILSLLTLKEYPPKPIAGNQAIDLNTPKSLISPLQITVAKQHYEAALDILLIFKSLEQESVKAELDREMSDAGETAESIISKGSAQAAQRFKAALVQVNSVQALTDLKNKFEYKINIHAHPIWDMLTGQRTTPEWTACLALADKRLDIINAKLSTHSAYDALIQGQGPRPQQSGAVAQLQLK